MGVPATQILGDLIFVNGQHSGRRVQLNSPRFIIGREVDCSLQLEDIQLSRHHAVLLTDAYAIRIRDLGSLNGTWVNGQKITSQMNLKHGDRVQVGETVLLLHAPALANVTETSTQLGLADTQAAPLRQPGQRYY
ncbi:MAG TPA: FHA domain-containing protein [Planctomycetaceae bacterium]|nr:FHA domain-containing protein [Planctomycetaceae bacterium]